MATDHPPAAENGDGDAYLPGLVEVEIGFPAFHRDVEGALDVFSDHVIRERDPAAGRGQELLRGHTSDLTSIALKSQINQPETSGSDSAPLPPGRTARRVLAPSS